MAQRLNVSANYIYMLEKGKVPGSKFVEAFENLERELVLAVREEEIPYRSPVEEKRLQCHDYLQKVLLDCGDDIDEVTYILGHLKRTFPLKEPAVRSPAVILSNSIPPEKLRASADAGASKVRSKHGAQEPGRSTPTDESNAGKS